MPAVCPNSWQMYGCENVIQYLWRSTYLFERVALFVLALMLTRVAVVVIRVSHRCYVARRIQGSSPAFQIGRRALVAELELKLRALRSIAYVAPYLGLAGTCLGLLDTLNTGYSGTWNGYFVMIVSGAGAALLSTLAGLLVTISATVPYNDLVGRIEALRSEIPRCMFPRCDRQFHVAESLPLRSRFSAISFGVLEPLILTSLMAVFRFCEVYETPTGLSVQVLPIGLPDEQRHKTNPPLVSLVRASDGGSTVVRLKSKRIPLSNWNTAVVRNIGRSAHGEVYVEADASLPWADVVRALDALKGSEADVVLLTTTPTPDSNVSKLRRR